MQENYRNRKRAYGTKNYSNSRIMHCHNLIILLNILEKVDFDIPHSSTASAMNTLSAWPVSFLQPTTVKFLKFRTLVACQNCLDKQCRPRSDCFWSLIMVFPVCYSDKQFANSSSDNQHFRTHRPRSNCFWRSSLIRAFPVCYSGNHFMNSSPDNHQESEMCLKFENIYHI